MNFHLSDILRKNIADYIKNQPASILVKEKISIHLNANENSLGSPLQKWYNRYPDQEQIVLKTAVSAIKGIGTEHILLGNGTDECIDILFRCFCDPQKDNVIICTPVYKMYEVTANLQNVEVRKATLLEDFQLDLVHLENLVDENTKIIWLCSPNNISGISLEKEDIEMVLNNFNGLVVIDEAYINFSKKPSLIKELTEYSNLVILQTFSKAWGLAALPLGLTMASSEIITILNKIKLPYNISQCTLELVVKAVENIAQVNAMIKELVLMRNALANIFQQLPDVITVYPSDGNFILVKLNKARKLYEFLLSKGIEVKDESELPLCDNCLRITIGNERENTQLIDAVFDFYTGQQK